MNIPSEKSIQRSQRLYLLEAALEYLISILVGGSFLATLTKELGFSDSLTGILSSVISLGCLFQLLSLSIRRTSVKRFVVVFSIANQILFLLLYVIPLTSFSRPVKTVLFVALIFSAYFIYNIAHPKKINWLMSLVDAHKRGSFTANKEIISLIAGMLFTFGMGAVIDYFSEMGQMRLALTISAAVIFLLMVLHSLTMIFSVEKPLPQSKARNLRQSLKKLVKNKRILHITVVFILYYAATYASTPFYGTYQIGELGLSLTFISAITIGGSVSRIFVSRFWGSYADRKTFIAMAEKCFYFLAAAQLCVVFAIPSTGKVMFILYYLLHGVAMGGINSALTNSVFENISPEQSADALAITQAFAGLVGFLTTLCISPLVAHIQENGFVLFGIPIYAQQLVTALALTFTVLAILYIRFAFPKQAPKE